MAVREIVRIDEELCDGCGDCVPACAERAIAIIDGTARLVGEVLCDGLGACLGHCPQGAITIERREAAPFDERAVAVHLAGDAVDDRPVGGCPSIRPRAVLPIGRPPTSPEPSSDARAGLRQWPVQLHLLHPAAPFLQQADLVLTADCVAVAHPDFHAELLRGRALAIACPKLDHGQDAYLEKLVTMIDHAGIRSLEVVVMEVPCCGGLVQLAARAARAADRDVPVTVTTVAIDGRIIARGVA